MTFSNYADTEKIAYLPNKLSITSPKGHSPKTGDIAYYIPWGNLAFYYKDGTASKSLTYIGKIISGLKALASEDANVKFTIKRLNKGTLCNENTIIVSDRTRKSIPLVCYFFIIHGGN
ncbi:cyclophilin-like fold protein [Gilliamella apicola]|uniref:cyclophilin-like fold protein n=1 Tax=Gilliamella sp. Choc5-1 TaxID=3120238 RepID=UPI00159EEB62